MVVDIVLFVGGVLVEGGVLVVDVFLFVGVLLVVGVVLVVREVLVIYTIELRPSVSFKLVFVSAEKEICSYISINITI